MKWPSRPAFFNLYRGGEKAPALAWGRLLMVFINR